MKGEPKPEHSYAAGVGARVRASARPVARTVAALIAAVAALLILMVPAASADEAPRPSLPIAASPAPDDPAPPPGPTATSPGISLGPGAPVPSDTAPAPGATGGTSTGGNSDPSFWDIPGQIEKAINDWFASLVSDALNPVLSLLGSTVLSTPDVTVMPRVGQIWTTMAVLANSFYVLFVLAGGVIVMTHETLQTRYAAKDIAPRLIAGFLVGNASLAVLGLIIHLSDALAAGIMGEGLDPKAAGTALAHMITGKILGSGGIFLAILGLVAAVLAVALLITYLVRVALMVLLAAAAPAALACHALPQTDPLARLWWRAVIGTLAVQVGQSLTLVAALRVFLDPAGQTALGFPTGSGLTDLLVFIMLFYILLKIPFWVGRSVFGPSRLLAMAKGIATYKLMGATGLRGRRRAEATRPSTGRTPGATPPGGAGGGGPRALRPGSRPPGGGPGPGTAGPRITVTRVGRPGPGRPRVIAGEVLATRAAPAIGPAPGAAAELPPGVQARLAKRQAETASKPKPRVVQPGLFPPVPRTPRPGSPSTITEFTPPPPPRTGIRQPALFDRRGQITAAAAPTNTSATAPSAAAAAVPASVAARKATAAAGPTATRPSTPRPADSAPTARTATPPSSPLNSPPRTAARKAAPAKTPPTRIAGAAATVRKPATPEGPAR
ncbi:hypothetical protein [Catenulispora rubra]|uniref:hypothetical protein n=1 Tax=Catenulispora rubra TaxID=280293 RepID=UPI0018926626|nr:hypothetical protein [Catenulispora rubra]